jgi:hypothetical protein
MQNKDFVGTKTAPYRKLYKDLRDDAQEWITTWKDINEYVLPRRGRYLFSEETEKYNQGERADQKIINSVATKSARTLAAGMQSGLTPHSRPWFVLGLLDKDLMEYDPVKVWINQVRDVMFDVFSRSNYYAAKSSIYLELGVFGIGAMLIEDDFETVARFRPFTIGEAFISLDSKYRAKTLARQFSMSAQQMIERFGEESLSDAAKASIKSNNGNKRFEVIHVIRPRSKEIILPRHLAYESVYVELSGDPNKFLGQSGYIDRPFVVPRWDVIGVDAYGGCPGDDTLGDNKMLQKMEVDKLKALDKYVDPPMNADVSLKAKGGNIASGGVNYIDTARNQTFTPAYQVNPEIQAIAFEIERVENRIKAGFFNDLFLSIITNDKNMTAREVVERHEEKMTILGPVVERVITEDLDPTVHRVFYLAQNMGLFPPMPEELQGREIKIEYISVLAQAQKMMGVSAIEQTAGFVGNLAAVFPSVVDKFDADEAVEEYAAKVGIAPQIIRGKEAVAELRQAQAQAQDAAIKQQQVAQTAQTAKVLSEVDTERPSALQALLGGGIG